MELLTLLLFRLQALEGGRYETLVVLGITGVCQKRVSKEILRVLKRKCRCYLCGGKSSSACPTHLKLTGASLVLSEHQKSMSLQFGKEQKGCTLERLPSSSPPAQLLTAAGIFQNILGCVSLLSHVCLSPAHGCRALLSPDWPEGPSSLPRQRRGEKG